MASVSRRGAVKVNPVTGAMTKLTDEEVRARSEGMHRDGALLISDTYINAAKDLGLGGAEGMYQHIAALKRVGGTDVPVGDSIEREGAKPSSGRAAAASSSSAGAGRSHAAGGSSSDVTAAEASKSTLKTTATATARGGKIAGFARATGGGSSLHTHADSFQRQKGVINTAHGVTDLKRRAEDKPGAGGDRSGPRVVSMDTIDTLSKDGRARIEARERRDRLAGPAAPSTGIHTMAGKSRDAGTGFTVAAPSKRLPTASRVAKAAAPLHAPAAATAAPAGSHKLVGGAKENDASGIAASRAAFFKARLAEEEERKAAARAAAAAAE